MIITLKTKIWLTVLSIVLMFSYFIFIYFPSQQEEHILENYTSEVQNIANTIGVGVEIAINEQNFRGITKELEIIKNDGRLSFVRLIEEDTVWSGDHLHYTIRDSTIFTFPEKAELPENFASNDSTIVKRVSLNTKLMNGNGAIMVGFKTNEIIESNRRIRRISIFISTIVFTIAILIGFWLSRNISRPVNALREATRKVGKGDFTQRVINNSTDEIGELSNSFNKMVEELANNDELKKANLSLASLNNTLNATIDNLKATQTQLIQSEKMASLGELTAGIAHEIQNPLNFINNFSEVNAELFDEMKNEMEAGNLKQAIEIANTIRENEQRITSHGKRADAIVKGMLQHSRTGAGQKEPSDINALSAEYLRLSYQGFRSRDKSFHSNIETNFDEKIGKIDIIPQDILRVLLNIYNNAFYAIAEKKKRIPDGYDPTVSVRTIGYPDKIEIYIRDNGMGIPKKVMDKIFQPFFTTKPAGQGTGLGLSLSYDIIKAHGGEIKLKTEEGEFAEFLIVLPKR